jgi:hypothetical protein
VQVVARVETVDFIGRSRFVSRYAYHHGCFDGIEREFRGFGMVEQWDTEEHGETTDFPEVEAANWDRTSWSPPTLTRTWFHTGAFFEAGALSRQYAHEYWIEPALRGDDRATDRAAMDSRQRAARGPLPRRDPRGVPRPQGHDPAHRGLRAGRLRAGHEPHRRDGGDADRR